MQFKELKHTVQEIVDAWKSNSLQRNDEYQRGETWSTQQKQALIDSILRGYPIPSLFLHAHQSRGLGGTLSEKFEVVDGQQRIIALSDFSSDKFALLSPEDRKLKLPKSMRSTPVTWAGKTFSQLGVDDLDRFCTTSLNVYVIEEVDREDQVRDLFIRLQSGTALTRQQIRDAWPGAIGPFIERLAGKLNRQPDHKVFGYVDGRGLRDEENDNKDPFVKHRTTCAQVVLILLTRMRDPGRIPAVGAPQLDALYHEETDLDVNGQAAARIRFILAQCDMVCSHFEHKAGGRKKLPKVGLFCLSLFFNDTSSNPHFKLTTKSYAQLARYVSDEAPKAPRNATESSQIKAYYDDWREKLPDGIGISLDPQRLFSNEQRIAIRERDGGKCAVCGEVVDADEEEFDHYPVLHRDGGRTEADNGRLVHERCHPRGKLLYLNPE